MLRTHAIQVGKEIYIEIGFVEKISETWKRNFIGKQVQI